MCGSLSNLPSKQRQALTLPTGMTVCPSVLDRDFSAIAAVNRGRLVQRVLTEIPPGERQRIEGWARGQTKSGNVDNGFVEIVIFYAIAGVAKTAEKIHPTVERISEQKTLTGILLPA